MGTAVFFGFVPLAAGLLGAFADQFFVTSAGEFWYADSSPYLWAMQNLSPVEHTSGLLLLFRTRMESKWLRY